MEKLKFLNKYSKVFKGMDTLSGEATVKVFASLLKSGLH